MWFGLCLWLRRNILLVKLRSQFSDVDDYLDGWYS
jgi:hypothetical protein